MALYGRFAVRLRAMVIDLMIVVGVLVIGIVIVDVVGSYMPSGVLMAGLMAAVVLYDPILVSRFGGTIGHRTANLRVVDAESGRRIGCIRAFVRFMLKAVLGIASFVIMALTRRHQALHDVVARSVVVIHDPSRAGSHDYVRESDFALSDVSVLRRILAVVSYSIGLFVASLLATAFLVSPSCLIVDDCSAAEDVFFNIVGVVLIVGIAGIVVVGWRGRLYGARGSRSIGNSTDS